MSVLNKIRSLFKFGYVSNIGGDEGNLPESQFIYHGQAKDIVTIYPYGFSANAPSKNMAVIVNMGTTDQKIAFTASGLDRFKNLKGGEVVVGNFVTGDFVKFNSEQKIEVVSGGSVDITAPAINVNGGTAITGDVTVSGGLTVSGDITGGSVTGGTVSTTGGIDLDTHTHFVSSAPGNSNPPQ
jgi:adhesin HecA-like repeat protein